MSLSILSSHAAAASLSTRGLPFVVVGPVWPVPVARAAGLGKEPGDEAGKLAT